MTADQREQEEAVCRWDWGDDGNESSLYADTGCGLEFYARYMQHRRQMRFCCYCGRPLQEQK